MLTFLDFIGDAHSDAGLAQPNQSPSGPQGQFARRKFEGMAKSWNLNRLRLFFIPEVRYVLTANQSIYTIGPDPANNYDTTDPIASGYSQPVYIQSGRVRVGTNRRWPLNILTRPQWDVLQSKGQVDPDGPLDLFYDYNVPTATINLSPAPTGAQDMWLSQWNPLKIFAEDEMALDMYAYYPPSYVRALQAGLAIELAQAYGRPASQELLGRFSDSIGVIEKNNNDKLSGSFGFSRTLDAPLKGDGSPVGAPQQ